MSRAPELNSFQINVKVCKNKRTNEKHTQSCHVSQNDKNRYSTCSQPKCWAVSAVPAVSHFWAKMNVMDINLTYNYTSVTLTRSFVYHWLVFQISDWFQIAALRFQRLRKSDFTIHNWDFGRRNSYFGCHMSDFRSHIISGLRSQVSGFIFQTSYFRFHISGFRIQVSYFRLHISGFRVQVSDFMFQVPGFMFQVSDFILQVSVFRFHNS